MFDALPSRLLPLLSLALMSCDPSKPGGKDDDSGIEEIDLGEPPTRSGVVEGFYGEVYAPEERLDFLRFIGEQGMNTWVYGPKSDPYHRARWRDPYPESWLQDFEALREAGDEAGVELCFALSPGLDVVYSDPEDFEAAMAKLEAASDRGISCFALFLDDIVGNLRGEDQERYGSTGEAHLDFIQRVRARLPELASDPDLIFCPTEYAWEGSSDYLETIADLPSDVEIFWTGPQIVSATVSAEQATSAARTLGRKALLWDNYPVNDFAPESLFLGPLDGRDPEIVELLSGILFNPMVQARASRIAVHTGAAFVSDPDSYELESAWEEAILEVGGEDAQEPLSSLAALCRPSRLDERLPEPISGLVEDYLLSIEEDAPVFEALLAELAELVALPESLAASLDDAVLLAELLPWAEKASTLAAAGEAAVDAMQMMLDEGSLFDMDAAWDAIVTSLRLWDEASADEAHELVADSFYALVHGPSSSLFDEALGLGGQALTLESSLGPYESYDLDRAADHDSTTSYWSNRAPRPGDHLEIDLGEPCTLQGFYLQQDEQDHLEDGLLLASLEGEDWVELTSLQDDYEIWTGDGSIEAQYLRIRVLDDQEWWWRIFELSVVCSGELVALDIETEIPFEERPERAVDRMSGSSALSSRPPEPGESMSILLPEEMALSRLSILATSESALDGAVLQGRDREGLVVELGALKGGAARSVSLGGETFSSLKLLFPSGGAEDLGIGEIVVAR